MTVLCGSRRSGIRRRRSRRSSSVVVSAVVTVVAAALGMRSDYYKYSGLAKSSSLILYCSIALTFSISVTADGLLSCYIIRS